MTLCAKLSYASLCYVTLCLSMTAALPAIAAAQEQQPRVASVSQGDDAAQTEREKKFVELLTNAKLVGRYTVTENLNEQPKADEYHIQSVAKVEGDKWRFVARVKYGNVDVNMPMVLPVQWAGDTPVITLDKLELPGLGTFSARVVFHGKKYAASWDGGDHGGFMWGTVEKDEAGDAEDK